MYEEFIAKRISTLRTNKNVSAREMSLAIGQNESYIIESKTDTLCRQCNVSFIFANILILPRKSFLIYNLKIR